LEENNRKRYDKYIVAVKEMFIDVGWHLILAYEIFPLRLNEKNFKAG